MAPDRGIKPARGHLQSQAVAGIAVSAFTATTSPAAASTTSFSTYCASSVGAPGNRSPKNSTSGDRIPTSENPSTSSPVRSNRPEISVIPMKHSITAVSKTAGRPWMIPKVSVSTVRITSASAGLAPGKNLSTPNPRKISPRLTRRMSTLRRPNQPATRFPL